jgi:hypothetical protein
MTFWAGAEGVEWNAERDGRQAMGGGLALVRRTTKNMRSFNELNGDSECST